MRADLWCVREGFQGETLVSRVSLSFGPPNSKMIIYFLPIVSQITSLLFSQSGAHSAELAYLSNCIDKTAKTNGFVYFVIQYTRIAHWAFKNLLQVEDDLSIDLFRRDLPLFFVRAGGWLWMLVSNRSTLSSELRTKYDWSLVQNWTFPLRKNLHTCHIKMYAR